MNATIVVPFTTGDPHRDRAWAWIERYLALHHPWPIVTGSCDGPWSKGRAVAEAMERVDTDIVIVHDADVFTGPEHLNEAVDLVASGTPWAVPHMLLYRLTEAASDQITSRPPEAGRADHRRARDVERYRYAGQAGGGIAVLPRSTWDRVPIDPRFVGWGGEDESWSYALDGIVGPHHRGAGALIHLWHPPQPNRPIHRDHREVRPETKALVARYQAAAGDSGALAAIIEEVWP